MRQKVSPVGMKTIPAVLILLAFTFRLSAADTNAISAPLKISTAEADKYYDQKMIVTGKVVQVTIRPNVTFLNLDKPYPNSPFTVVIFHGHSSFYGDANALRGKSVEIKGKIRNYRDKPEIVLDNTNQLTVLGATISTNAPVVLPSTNALPAAGPTNVPPPTPSTNFPEIM
jgi:DNA/RNA endonuclease YhcR with UshA esterase domain